MLSGYILFPPWLGAEIIPGLPLRWYGMMYVVAFAITYWLLLVQIKERKLGFSKDLVGSLISWSVGGLLIGARVLAVTLYDTTGRFWTQPWILFWPFNDQMQFTGLAGMSYHGALIGIVVAIYLWARVKKQDFLVWGDLLGASVPLGYTFGRLGNFINAELYGRVTDAPWGVIFPGARQVPTAEPWVQDLMTKLNLVTAEATVNLPRHPSQIYEALTEGILLWLLFWVVLQFRPRFKGFFVSLYLVGYGLARFLVEYFRTPDAGLDFPIMFEPVTTTSHLFISPWNFTTGQILSFGMIVLGAGLWVWFRSLPQQGFPLFDFTAPVPGRPAPAGLDAEALKAKRQADRKLRKKLK